MVYINKETFNIREDVPDREIDNYFEVDELIAPVISILNKKGYYTEFCCNGHPYISETEGLIGISKESTIEKLLKEEPYIIYIDEDIEKMKDEINIEDFDGYNNYYYKMICRSGFSPYIAFTKDIDFDLPEGWEMRFDPDNEDEILDLRTMYLHLRKNVNINKYIEENLTKPFDFEISEEFDNYLFFQIRLDEMKKLYEWACNLPSKL